MMTKRWVERHMQQSLRRSFRRVCWAGSAPELAAGRPVVLYANHHYFHDGYLLWLLLDRLVGRPGITWMAEWSRFPFFTAAGALPFPPGDATRRAATLRHTLHRLRARPETMLVLFPEGRLHPPGEGVLPFDRAPLVRLGRLLPEALWWPVALDVAWRGDPRPTAVLAGGVPHGVEDLSPGRLERLLARLRSGEAGEEHVLLDGRRGPQERWSFTLLQRLFHPYRR